MKKSLFIPVLFAVILFLPTFSFAQLQQHIPGTPDVNLPQIVTGLVSASWIFFTVVVVFAFVMAGILFMTAQGDPGKLKLARDAFLWGIAGVIVGLLAYSMITIVINLIS